MGTAGSGTVDDRRPLNGVSGGRTKGELLVKESPRRRQGDWRDGVAASAGRSSTAGARPAARADVSRLLSHVPGSNVGSARELQVQGRAVSTDGDLDLSVWLVCFVDPRGLAGKGLAGSRNMLGGGQGFALLGQPGCGWRPGPTEARVVGAPLQAITRQLLPAQRGA